MNRQLTRVTIDLHCIILDGDPSSLKLLVCEFAEPAQDRAGVAKSRSIPRTTRYHFEVSTEHKICVRCGEPVIAHAAQYEIFEKMHWLCFHLEFEHEGDPDQPCGDPSCPWWHIEVFRKAITALGHDPNKVIEQAIKDRLKLS